MNKNYIAIICLAKAIIGKDPEVLLIANKLAASLTHEEIKEVWERLTPILSDAEVQWYKNSLAQTL